MAQRWKKPSETLSMSDNSNLGDSPLVPLRSVIPSYHDNLEGFRFEDRTLYNPRSSGSDSNLSYPSNEPSLLEQLRSGLSQGIDIHKLMNSKKVRKDMTINFSLANSSESFDSTVNLTLPPERRHTNLLARKKRSHMTMNFTMNGSTSSCDNQENESPVLANDRPKAVFKKPAIKKMSICIDDVSTSDSSKISIHDNSHPSLDPNCRPSSLKPSLCSRATAGEDMTLELTLDNSGSSNKAMDERSLLNDEPSSSALIILPGIEEVLPKQEPQRRHLPLRSSRSRATLKKDMIFDISLDSTKESEKSITQAGTFLDPLPLNPETFVGEPATPENMSGVDRTESVAQVVSTSKSYETSRSTLPSPKITDEGTKSVVEAQSGPPTGDSSMPISKASANLIENSVQTYLTHHLTPRAKRDTPQPEESSVEFDTGKVAPTESIPNLTLSITGTHFPHEVRESPLSEEMHVDAPLSTERTVACAKFGGTESVAQAVSTKESSEIRRNLEDSLTLTSRSKQDGEPGRDKFSFTSQLDNIVIDGELSNNGVGDNDMVGLGDVGGCSRNEGSSRNLSASSLKFEDSTEGHGNSKAIESDVPSSSSRYSDAVSLGISLGGVPQSLNVCSLDSFRSSQKISLLIPDDSNVCRRMRPSVEGCSDVFCPGADQSSPDELHLELSLTGSLQYSGTDCSDTLMKEADAEEEQPSSLPQCAHVEEPQDIVPSPASQGSSVLFTKNVPLLRRSKRGSKNISLDVDLSDSKSSIGNVTGLMKKLYKNPLKTKSKQNKMSIAFADETNDPSSFSKADIVTLSDSQKASNPNMSSLLGNVTIAVVQNDSSPAQDELQIPDAVNTELRDVGIESLTPLLKNPSLNKSTTSKKHSNVPTNGDDCVLRCTSISGVAGISPSSGTLQNQYKPLPNPDVQKPVVGHVEGPHNVIHTPAIQDSSVLLTKDVPVLRRSKRGSKSVSIDVDLSDSKSSIGDATIFMKKAYKNPLEAKSKQKKVSIAFTDETNDLSSVSESDKVALTDSQKVSNPNNSQPELGNPTSAVAPDDSSAAQKELQIHDAVNTELREVGSESLAPLLNNPSLNKAARSEQHSNLPTGDIEWVFGHTSISGVAGISPSSGTLQNHDELLAIQDNVQPVVTSSEIGDPGAVTETSRSALPPPTYSDEGIQPEVEAGLPTSVPIPNSTPTLIENFVQEKVSHHLDCHPADEDSSAPSSKGRLSSLRRSNLGSQSVINEIVSNHSNVSDDQSIPSEGAKHLNGILESKNFENTSIVKLSPDVVQEQLISQTNDKGVSPSTDVEQLRSNSNRPAETPCEIREPSPFIGLTPESVHLPFQVAISKELESVALLAPNTENSRHSTEEGRVDGNLSPLPPTTQTNASSMHLHITTFRTDAGNPHSNATNGKSHSAVPLGLAVQEADAVSLMNPGDFSVAKEISTLKGADAVLAQVGTSKPLEKPVIEEGKTKSTCVLHLEMSSQIADCPSQQEGSSTSRPQQTVRHPFIVNDMGPPASNIIPTAGPSGITTKNDPREPISRKSKRKSVSFKPSTENLYHSPPDHTVFQSQAPNGDGKDPFDNGYEFSRIQMTTDISEIQSSPTVKRAKRLISSTPISKFKKSEFDTFVQPQPLTSTNLPNDEFLVPPPISVTKRVSIQPVPEIIVPIVASGGQPGSAVDDVQGSSRSGSSYDISYENSLEISAIPKDVTALKRGNVVYHSTPLHQTKASLKRTRKKQEHISEVPHAQESPVLEQEPAAVAVNHSVQTSRTLRSRSKTSLESSSAPDHPSQSASVTGSLRRSARRNQIPGPVVDHTPKSVDNKDPGNDPVDGSPADRISIQDNTIVSTNLESLSRARGSRSRSTMGSTLKSYDSHRKMTSRRLFSNAAENKSPTGQGTESSPPQSTDLPPTSNDISATRRSDGLLSNSAPSIIPADQLSYLRTDVSNSILSAQQPEDVSDNESVISTATTGSSSSNPSHVVMRQSFESQLSLLRYKSKSRGVEKVAPPRMDPPKPISKHAIARRDTTSNLNLLYPADVTFKQRKRTHSTSVKLFNPGAKWKKSKQLYKWLKKKLEPEYQLRTSVESELLVIELEHARVRVSQGHKENALDLCVKRLHRLNICTNQLELWGFFMKFMPFEFVREMVPMGGAFGQPFDPNDEVLPFDPI